MEPFFTTKPPGAGSGLGLSMIYGFAKQSGGHLTIESEPGRGTTVRLYLPRAQIAGSDPVDGVANPSLPKGDEAILLVDDNVEMRTVVRRHLASLGYQVSEAASGPAALAILRNDDNFDLLFTDVVMPGGMTGYQLAAVAQKLHPRLRVLFTTGYARALPGSDPVVAHPAPCCASRTASRSWPSQCGPRLRRENAAGAAVLVPARCGRVWRDVRPIRHGVGKECKINSVSPRLGWRNPGDLHQQLAQDRLTEAAGILCHHYKGIRATDDIVAVVSLETGLNLDDRQAIDGDAGSHGGIPRLGDRPAVVVRAVA